MMRQHVYRNSAVHPPIVSEQAEGTVLPRCAAGAFRIGDLDRFLEAG
jgi:hypothetical protein